MSILSKIRKLFEKEELEKTAEKNLNIEELENWLKEESNNTLKNLNGEKQHLRNQLDIGLTSLENFAGILENVNLNERKEYERIKQITELGKTEYISAIRRLISILREPNEIGFISDEINKFAISSQKSHFKATYLIGKEIEDIIITISSIRKLEDDFLKSNKGILEKQEALNYLLDKIKDRKDTILEKKEISNEILKLNEILAKTKENIRSLNMKINKIEESSESNDKKKLIEEKIMIDEDLRIHEYHVRSIIDKRVLEKYIYYLKNNSEKNIEKYIEDPIGSLLKDDELTIKGILIECVQKIKNGSIKIKEPEKIASKISLGISKIENYKNAVRNLKENSKLLSHKIDSIKLDTPNLKNEINKENMIIEENSRQLEALSKKEGRLQNKLKEINSYIAKNIGQFGLSLTNQETF